MSDPPNSRNGGQLLELPTDDLITPSSNRVITLDTVTDLLTSIREEGQLVPGLVYPHPERTGKWVCVGGNRRLFCCRALGLKFKALAVDGPVTEEREIRIRLTENVCRRSMSLLEISEDIQRYQQVTGITCQKELGAALKIGQPEICRALKLPKMLDPSLHECVRDFRLNRSVAEAIASIPSHEAQREVAKRVLEGDLHGAKRDSVIRVCDHFKGKKPKAERVMKLTHGGVVATVKGGSTALGSLKAFCLKAMEVVKKIERDNLPPDILPGMMG